MAVIIAKLRILNYERRKSPQFWSIRDNSVRRRQWAVCWASPFLSAQSRGRPDDLRDSRGLMSLFDSENDIMANQRIFYIPFSRPHSMTIKSDGRNAAVLMNISVWSKPVLTFIKKKKKWWETMLCFLRAGKRPPVRSSDTGSEVPGWGFRMCDRWRVQPGFSPPPALCAQGTVSKGLAIAFRR